MIFITTYKVGSSGLNCFSSSIDKDTEAHRGKHFALGAQN